MEVVKFLQLSQEKQIEAVYTLGVYIGKQRVDSQVVLLYQLSTFYVELYYHQYRIHIDRLIVSNAVGVIDPYLKQIDVPFLNRPFPSL